MRKPGRTASLSDLPQLASLRHREYRNTFLANVCSSAAMWTFAVASGWLVFVESGTSGWVGVITFSSMVPSLVFSPIGGLVGDQYDRRRVALFTFVFSSAILWVLALLAMTGHAQLWLVAAMAFAAGVARYIREPAMQALIPNQVPREDLLNALVLNGASRHGARFFGLLIAAPLLKVGFIGVNGVLVLSAVFHALGALQMARVGTASTGKMSPEHGLFRKLVDGLAYIYSHQAMALIIILVAFHCALVMSFASILPVFSKDSLGAKDGAIFGYLMMGFGIGALLGMSILASVRTESRKGQLLLLTGVASGATPMMLAMSTNVPVAVLLAGTMGASQATFMALTNTYVQVMTPDRLRARISSLYALHAGGIMAFSNLGYGFLADAFSAPPILMITGALFIAIVVSLAVGQPFFRQVYRTGQVAPA